MTTLPITLRPARVLDAGRLGGMITQAVQDAPWKPVLHSGADDIAHAGKMIERGWVTVADLGRETAGFMALEDGYIHSLFVSRDHRRNKIATTLLNAAKDAYSTLTLWTFEANTAARQLYTAQGFSEIGRTDGDNDEGLPDIRFQWRAERTAR